jgi:hypothetical protein
MFNFDEKSLEKRYGRVKRGWHHGRIFQGIRGSSRRGTAGQYIKVDIEIIGEKQFKDILVPAFFFYNEGRKADQNFLSMGAAAGLRRNYGDDLNKVLQDIIGKELKILVVHRYKGGQRRDRAVDFKPLQLHDDKANEMSPGDSA